MCVRDGGAPGNGGGQTGELDYFRGEPERWRAQCPGFSVQSVPGAGGPHLEVTGECPRCTHPISMSLRAQDGVVALAEDDAEESACYLVTCNCVRGHPDAPDGVFGCGAQGGIRLASRGGTFQVHYHEITPEQRRIEAWMDDAISHRLTKMRTWAQQWMALLTAITGLVSFGAVLDAAGDLGALSWGWRLLYATLGGMALACIVTAVVRAWQASNPIKFDELQADCKSHKDAYDKAVEYSTDQLTDSYGWAVASVVLFVASMVVRIMTAPPPA
jgi:hypothetical protein